MTTTKQQAKSSDALVILDKITGDDAELKELIAHERSNLQVARAIYKLRINNNLSQGELAKKVGTTQSVISRLEDADYEGHSFAMLQRIASALNKTVEVRFVPKNHTPPHKLKLV